MPQHILFYHWSSISYPIPPSITIPYLSLSKPIYPLLLSLYHSISSSTTDSSTIVYLILLSFCHSIFSYTTNQALHITCHRSPIPYLVLPLINYCLSCSTTDYCSISSSTINLLFHILFFRQSIVAFPVLSLTYCSLSSITDLPFYILFYH